MNMQQRLLISATVMLLATGNVWAASATGCANGNGIGLLKQCPQSAPEMDTATATIPFALIAGIVLLMKERKRSKRPSDSDE